MCKDNVQDSGDIMQGMIHHLFPWTAHHGKGDAAVVLAETSNRGGIGTILAYNLLGMILTESTIK